MKRWMLFLSLCLTISAGCSATPPASPTATARSAPPTPTQWFPPRPTLSPTPSPTNTPHPSPSSSPAQTPGVIAPQLTNPPDLAPGTNTVVDCAAVYPGVPGCLHQESFVGGRLAFVDERPPFNNRSTVIDLEHGGAWTLGKYQGNPMGWSPSGEYLLQLEYAGEGRSSYRVYRFDGMLVGEWSSLPTAPFWAPPDAFTGARDWLAAPTSDGALLAISQPRGQQRQVLPPGSLSTDERDNVHWSRDGWLAWSPTYDHLVAARQREQQLFVHLADGGRQPLVWRLSEDFSKTYYQILDWVPGTRLILAAKGMACNSCWTWGVPLVAINADTGKVTELNASMLLTPEAYAWHPAQPGLLALAEGSSRYLNDPRRLALLDVTTGKFDYLTDQDTTVFEPAWSPDGKLLAYAAVRASPNASGDGATLERLLNGRAIYIADPQSGKIRKLTQPPDDAVDGWPQWSSNGEQLLYTRQHDNVMDVRIVTLESSHDELLVTGLPRPKCNYGGCGWSRMLAYCPGSEAKR